MFISHSVCISIDLKHFRTLKLKDVHIMFQRYFHLSTAFELIRGSSHHCTGCHKQRHILQKVSQSQIVLGLTLFGPPSSKKYDIEARDD
jgi:hypothetical protein